MQLNLDQKRLDITFIFCLALTIIFPLLVPSIRLTFFAPFLIMACYKKKLQNCLWMAFICGLILDLLSSNARLGIHAFNYCLTLMVLYPQKRNFFADSLSTLPIMTFLFSTISTFFMVIVLYSLEMINMLSWQWIATDLLLMPAADAIYAFCCFIAPALLFGRPRRRGKDYFLSQ